jgi:hypothetical protein
MIPVSSPSNNIYLHAVQVDKPVLEIAELPVLSTGTAINAGNGVVLDTTANGGKVILATADAKVLGLAKNAKNAYADETAGALGGIYGSGCMTVVSKGIVTLRHSYYQNTAGAIVTVKGYDDTAVTGILPATNPMIALYITAAGLVTTAALAVGTTNCKIGFLLVPPTATNPAIQIYLDC